jgi:RecA-family ATPase
MGLFETLSPEGTPIYLANLPSEKGQGRVGHEWARNDAELKKFIANYDKPGRALYFTVARLKAGTTRSKDNVEAVNWLWAEIDFKNHPDLAADEIRRRVEATPLPPTLIVASGHGLHLYWKMNEAVDASPGKAQLDVEEALKLACNYVGGDPSAAEAARLLRLPGSHNRKSGGEILVSIVAENEHSYELSDLIDFWLEAQPIMPAPAKTGDSHVSENTEHVNSPGSDGPIDVETELAAMRLGNINKTHCRVIGALLSQGTPYDEIAETVVDATMRFAEQNGISNWTREREFSDHVLPTMAGLLKGRCRDAVAGTISSWVAPELHEAWLKISDAGGRPLIVWRKDTGWHVKDMAWAWNKASSPAKNNAKETPTNDKGEPRAAAPKSENPKKGPQPFNLQPFVPFDLATLPPREWLYGRHYQRRTVSATIAPGGFGKTTLCMVEAVAMATCRNLLGEQPAERLRVWYHNGEDNLEELRRRLGAICLHYQIPQQELGNWFFMTSGSEVPLRVAVGYNELKIDQALIKRIGEAIEINQIDVAILDPLVTLHSVPEADNTKMDAVIRIFAGIADGRDCSVELAHHTRKLPAGSNGNDYVAADIRGASALRDAVRAARMLNQMKEDDAGDSGIQEHERANYFRVDRVKANNAPAARALWRRFVNVDLPNGDEVGVVTLFNFPSQGAPSPEKAKAEQDAENLFRTLLARLTLQGRVVSHSPGTNYAPLVFSLESEAKAAGIGKKALADAMRGLFAANRIRVEPTGKGGRNNRIVAV